MSTEATPAVHPAPDAMPAPRPTKAPSDRRFGIILFLVTLVVGLMVVLSGPTLMSSLLVKPQSLQTKAVMKSVEIGIKGYLTEYLRLPYPGTMPPPLTDNAPYSTTSPAGKDLLDILLGTHAANNPRHIRFWDPPPTKSSGAGFTPGLGLKDPWGTEYHIILDYDGNSLILDPEGSGGTIKAPVLIYSAGPDKDFTTWKDNVCSWK
jgi:hypothetical protein